MRQRLRTDAFNGDFVLRNDQGVTLRMDAAGATTAVVVEPGMTLSQVAAEQLPELPLDRAVVDIQRANRLSTTDIAVGQELLIPGR